MSQEFLIQEHFNLEERAREQDCYTAGETWITYFENHYLSQYSAITSNLRIYKRKTGKLVALYLNPKGKSTKVPYRKFLIELDKKINQAFHVEALERYHIRNHLQIKVIRKHRQEIRDKLKESE